MSCDLLHSVSQSVSQKLLLVERNNTRLGAHFTEREEFSISGGHRIPKVLFVVWSLVSCPDVHAH